MTMASKWQDLTPRVLSGLAMAVLGGLDVWIGGWAFRLLVCVICGVIIWESARMFDAPHPRLDGALACAILLLASTLSAVFVLPLFGAAAFVSAGRVGKDKLLFSSVYLWILIACLAIILLREQAALVWLLWLICVVVVTDIAGYFAGRMLGGPKFWPSISPKKTWSGTTAGWIAAACIGFAFAGHVHLGWLLVPWSVAMSFASQLGDIAESAVKRRMDVKDSSNLIPGHGGVFDRFDGLLGASIMMTLLWALYALGQSG